MKVLALFDGMSCGQIALQRAGFKVDAYYASEIDKYAIQVTQNNYPNTVQLGDIKNWKDWPLLFGLDWSEIDLVLAGSPCQGFSFAGKQLAFDDPRSVLFFEYVNIFEHIFLHNPNVKFLLENVRMKKEHLEVISKFTGVKPLFINSALVSAQNRQRYYWTNIEEVGLPKDKGIELNDVLLSGESDRTKSHCLDSNYYKKGYLEDYFKKSRRQIVFEKPAHITGRRLNKKGVRDDYNKNVKITQCLEVQKGVKMNCLTTVKKATVVGFLKPGRYPNVFENLQEHVLYRYLNPIECERLQTVPDNYTSCVSANQRHRMLGNGWTVDVIVHILSYLL